MVHIMKQKYKVLRRNTRVAGVLAKVNSVVELDEQQAKNLINKVELITAPVVAEETAPPKVNDKPPVVKKSK